MLKLTRQSDYAVVLLALVARAGADRVASARELADASHLPLPMVSKTLKALTRAKLLASVRGVAGGYKLAVDPAATSLAAILDRLEGPVALTTCAEPASRKTGTRGCGLMATCPTSGVWQTINAKLRAALESVSLTEVATHGVRHVVHTSPSPETPSPLPLSAHAYAAE